MAGKYPFKRDFYEDVVKSIQNNGAIFVLGPRRCGKTVCLTQVNDAYENAEYMDFKKLNTEQQGMEVLSRIQKSIEDDEDKIYLLDVCYATLFTLHNHVNSGTFIKNERFGKYSGYQPGLQTNNSWRKSKPQF